MNCEKAEEGMDDAAEQVYGLCDPDADLTGQGFRSRFLLQTGQSYWRIAALSASNRSQTAGCRIRPCGTWPSRWLSVVTAAG